MRVKIFFVSVLAVIFLLPQVSGYNLSVKLKINNTINTIYIPGAGEQGSGSLPTESSYTNPPHFYIASYYGDFLNGLASSTGQEISAGREGDYHFIGIRQEVNGSRIFLAVTKGNWHAMDERIPLIEAGRFLSQISPSFAFPLGGLYPIRLLLKYPNIDINGDFVIAKGIHKIVVENKGISSGKPVVEIRKAD
ncbi:MAG: hypothetical protein QW286_01435 [Candidatus Aenigmatarchaeota archaeon]